MRGAGNIVSLLVRIAIVFGTEGSNCHTLKLRIERFAETKTFLCPVAARLHCIAPLEIRNQKQFSVKSAIVWLKKHFHFSVEVAKLKS